MWFFNWYSTAKVQQKMHIRKQSEEINKKKIDSIYLIRYTALAQACLKAKCWRVDDKVQTGFLINFERAVVCAALRVKECDGTHSECCARRVPTLRSKRDT